MDEDSDWDQYLSRVGRFALITLLGLDLERFRFSSVLGEQR